MGQTSGCAVFASENKGQEKSKTSGASKLTLVMCLPPSQPVSESSGPLVRGRIEKADFRCFY